jgi:methyl coenzyme M reductase gamma subunit
MAEITRERWNEAQIAERKFHDDMPFDEGVAHYKDSYMQYFSHVGIDANDLKGKSIMEIGCADYPAISYCNKSTYPFAVIVEPMPSPYLHKIIDGNEKVLLIPFTVEDSELKSVDETWVFNVLQHVINPEKFIEKIKKVSKVIRFFEPINTGLNECHPHTFTLEYFKEQFGDVVNHYPFNDKAINFHTWECAYGVWSKY